MELSASLALESPLAGSPTGASENEPPVVDWAGGPQDLPARFSGRSSPTDIWQVDRTLDALAPHSHGGWGAVGPVPEILHPAPFKALSGGTPADALALESAARTQREEPNEAHWDVLLAALAAVALTHPRTQTARAGELDANRRISGGR
jgi:hypothetical protein